MKGDSENVPFITASIQFNSIQFNSIQFNSRAMLQGRRFFCLVWFWPWLPKTRKRVMFSRSALLTLYKNRRPAVKGSRRCPGAARALLHTCRTRRRRSGGRDVFSQFVSRNMNQKAQGGSLPLRIVLVEVCMNPILMGALCRFVLTEEIRTRHARITPLEPFRPPGFTIWDKRTALIAIYYWMKNYAEQKTTR